MEICPGCGARHVSQDGPVHAYMTSSPSCFAAFNALLAAEYSCSELSSVHRLTVDAWAVQHPGSPNDRRAVQSVGLHLARLLVQLESPRPPKETNEIMLGFSKFKHTLPPLLPPEKFRITAADVEPFAGTDMHVSKVRAWARSTWEDWSEHHDFVRNWVAQQAEVLKI